MSIRYKAKRRARYHRRKSEFRRAVMKSVVRELAAKNPVLGFVFRFASIDALIDINF